MRRPGKKNALGHAFLFQFAPSGHVRSPHAHSLTLPEKNKQKIKSQMLNKKYPVVGVKVVFKVSKLIPITDIYKLF